MLLAIYASPGAGLFFLFVLALLGAGVVGWVAYWSLRGFRASPARSRAGRNARRLAAGLALALAATVVPMRRAGDWQNETTGGPAPAHCARRLDRYLYGYIPSHAWIGSTGRRQPDEPGSIVTVGPCGPYAARSYAWVVDAPFMAAQIGVVIVILLPYWRAREKH